MGSIPQLSILKGQIHGGKKGLRPLHRQFEEAAAAHPNHTAFIYEDGSNVSRRETLAGADKRANQMARGILARCLNGNPNSDGDFVVAVALPPSDLLLLALLAINKSGAAYLPLDHNAPKERTRHILNESKPILVIHQSDELDDAFDNLNVVSIHQLEEEAASMCTSTIPDDSKFQSPPDPIEIILYTSGSTGLSKGVRIRCSSITNRLQWQFREFPYGPEEEYCIFKTALTFVDSVSEIWGPFINPSRPRTVVIVPKTITTDPQRLIALLDKYKIGRLVLVPTLLRTILMYLDLSKEPGSHLRHLKLWVCSGETLSVSLALQFLDHFNGGTHTLCNFYGSTEIMGDVTYHTIREASDVSYNNKVPIGIPLDNTLIYLLDKDLQVVNAGDLGEMYVAGKNLSPGYVNGRDKFRFISNPHTIDPDYNTLYKTGDYARIVKGTVIFEGRTDSQIKVRGHRVDLSEVETALNRIKGVSKGVVLCYNPEEIDQELVAFVLLEDNMEMTSSEMENALKNSLPLYAIPQVVMMEKIPLLVNGKVDRQGLLQHYRQLSSQGKQLISDFDYDGIPQEERAKADTLFNVIGSVLGSSIRERISPESNFYQLGGNSLNSVFTISRLRNFGYSISITDFITAKTLRDVISRMVHESENSLGHENEKESKYTYEMLQDKHKEAAFRMIADSFYEKSDIEIHLVPPPERDVYIDLMNKLWEPLVEKNLSFIVKSDKEEPIGISMMFDAHDEPEVSITTCIKGVFDFLEYLEGPNRDNKLPKGKGKILHSFMLGTKKGLSPGENVEVTQEMEEIALKICKERGFLGLFTTNTNPLTQQLATEVFNYQVLQTYQVNQFVACDGTRPFRAAPDEVEAMVCWKPVNHH